MEPAGEMDIAALAAAWRETVVEARLAGMAAYAASPSLLNKVRGAWGHALLEGASENTRQRLPCDWPRACAAEIFFGAKPCVELPGGRAEIAKPFVLQADAAGADLIVRLRIFGIAGQWGQEAALAFAQALRARVRWRDLARDNGLFAPREVRVTHLSQDAAPPLERAASLPLTVEFLTSVDCERGSMLDDPWLLFERLHHRAAMMARWHGAALAADDGALEEAWLALPMEARAPAPPEAAASAGGHKFRNRVRAGLRLFTGAPLEQHGSGPLLLLLELGARMHAGRGATTGLGRYHLTFGDQAV